MGNDFIICYTDTITNESHFVKTNNVEEWKRNHATLSYKIDYVFREKWDIENNTSERETSFRNNCSKYGYTTNDLHAKFKSNKGHTIELLGLNLKNRKYKFIIFDYDDNKEYKVSERYMATATRLP